MSLSKDAAEIKKMVEAKPVFKAASPEEAQARRNVTATQRPWAISKRSPKIIESADGKYRIAKLFGDEYDSDEMEANGKLIVNAVNAYKASVTEAKPVFKAADQAELNKRRAARGTKLYRFIYKCYAVIEAASPEDAQSRFEEIDLFSDDMHSAQDVKIFDVLDSGYPEEYTS